MAEVETTGNKPPPSKPGTSTTQKRHWQLDLEKRNGVRLSQFNWKVEDMRELDGAGVNEGWCKKTGFWIRGTKGHCGFTGYKWSPKAPFVAVIFEKKLQLEMTQRELEKVELREERIARITRKIETSPDIMEERKHWEQARRRGMLDSDTDSEREEVGKKRTNA